MLADDDDKYGALEAILERDFDGARIVVFCATKRRCDALTRQLRLGGWPARAIHGDKSQTERDWVLREFRSGASPIMLATDVAARGLGVSLAYIPSLVNYSTLFTALSSAELRLGKSVT